MSSVLKQLRSAREFRSTRQACAPRAQITAVVPPPNQLQSAMRIENVSAPCRHDFVLRGSDELPDRCEANPAEVQIEHLGQTDLSV
jgi:hypothetical protein